MGYMGEIYKAINERNKERREQNLFEAEQYFEGVGNEWVKHTEYHWSISLQEQRLNYWPSTNRWMWRKKKYTGKPRDLMNFIKKRESKN